MRGIGEADSTEQVIIGQQGVAYQLLRSVILVNALYVPSRVGRRSLRAPPRPHEARRAQLLNLPLSLENFGDHPACQYCLRILIELFPGVEVFVTEKVSACAHLLRCKDSQELNAASRNKCRFIGTPNSLCVRRHTTSYRALPVAATPFAEAQSLRVSHFGGSRGGTLRGSGPMP